MQKLRGVQANMIRIAICDDNKSDIDIIHEYITAYFLDRSLSCEIEIFKSGEALLESENIFDTILLDVEMKGISGIQTGKRLKSKNRSVKILYVTNFPQYWAEALNSVHAFAYLQKPISLQDIAVQMDEILQSTEKHSQEEQEVIFEILKISKEYEFDKEFKKFKIDSIYYFEYVNRKIKIKASDGEYYFSGQMKDVMNQMKTPKFASCHQCFLINLEYVKKMKDYKLYLENGEMIPISQKKSSSFRYLLHEYIRKNI